MDTQQPKILLIDDDSYLINMYALKFGKSGFDVSSALSSQEALKKLQDGYHPDIILLDIIMPAMDGLELLSEIRKQKLAESTTIIMLTNQSDTSDIEKAKSLGVSGYIVKATTIPSEVISNVQEIYKNHKA
ncbi:MAG: response regulator [Patescibacteria group bacterium]